MNHKLLPIDLGEGSFAMTIAKSEIVVKKLFRWLHLKTSTSLPYSANVKLTARLSALAVRKTSEIVVTVG